MKTAGCDIDPFPITLVANIVMERIPVVPIQEDKELTRNKCVQVSPTQEDAGIVSEPQLLPVKELE